jgi:hypothetical protein
MRRKLLTSPALAFALIRDQSGKLSEQLAICQRELLQPGPADALARYFGALPSMRDVFGSDARTSAAINRSILHTWSDVAAAIGFIRASSVRHRRATYEIESTPATAMAASGGAAWRERHEVGLPLKVKSGRTANDDDWALTTGPLRVWQDPLVDVRALSLASYFRTFIHLVGRELLRGRIGRLYDLKIGQNR